MVDKYSLKTKKRIKNVGFTGGPAKVQT